MRRRQLLLGLLAGASFACGRPQARPSIPTPSAAWSEADAWAASARSLLIEGLAVLRTFDAHAAYRVTSAPRSSLRSTREPEWDPPPVAEWERASRAAPALRQRALQLHQAVAASQPDPALWRERRHLAEATYTLRELGDALEGYYNAAVSLEPDSDGGPALTFLGRSWNRWEAAAAYWGAERGQLVECA